MMFYWILEMGISIVAVSLPSIWMVFASIAPDAILRSIRSVVSLASMRSGSSRRSRERSNAEHLKSHPSNSSIAPISGSSAEVDVYELHNNGSSRNAVPPGEIRISHSVEQSSNLRRN